MRLPVPDRIGLHSIAVGFAVFMLLLATAGDYGVSWDEPVYIAGVDRLEAWFSTTFSSFDGLRKGFAADRLEENWVFARPENRNLPFPVLLSLAGHEVSRHWLAPPVSYRVGVCALVALTAGILFGSMARWHGQLVATVATGTLILMPHAFVHAHLAATDAPVSSLWLLTLLAWLRSETNKRWRLFAVLFCGLGMATKATFLLLPILLLLWTVIFRRWTWLRSAALLAVGAPLVMLALCPMWWPAPIERPIGYFRSVVRAEDPWKIETFYLGKTYKGGENPVPWHNGIVYPLVTTPPWVLVLVAISAVRWFRSRDAQTGLWIMAAAVLPVLRLLPNAPAHDGIRLMLPSVFCFAPLAGLVFRRPVTLLAERDAPPSSSAFGPPCSASGGALPTYVRWLLAILVLTMGTAEVITMHPCEMSYYSELVGGLRGAEALGFEVSYWYEPLSASALRELQARLPPGARVWIYPPYEGLPLLRQWGFWRGDLRNGAFDDADYLLLYTRKGRFKDIPAMEDYYSAGRPVWTLERQGVQIVGLYRL